MWIDGVERLWLIVNEGTAVGQQVLQRVGQGLFDAIDVARRVGGLVRGGGGSSRGSSVGGAHAGGDSATVDVDDGATRHRLSRRASKAHSSGLGRGRGVGGRQSDAVHGELVDDVVGGREHGQGDTAHRQSRSGGRGSGRHVGHIGLFEDVRGPFGEHLGQVQSLAASSNSRSISSGQRHLGHQARGRALERALRHDVMGDVGAVGVRLDREVRVVGEGGRVELGMSVMEASHGGLCRTNLEHGAQAGRRLVAMVERAGVEVGHVLVAHARDAQRAVDLSSEVSADKTSSVLLARARARTRARTW